MTVVFHSIVACGSRNTVNGQFDKADNSTKVDKVKTLHQNVIVNCASSAGLDAPCP